MSFWSEYVVRSKATTVLVDDDFEETSSFTNFRVTQSVLSGLGLAYASSLLLYILKQSRQVRRNPAQKKTFLLLLVHVISANCCLLGIFVLSVIRIEPEMWPWCSFAGSLPSPFYVLGHASNYLIFLQRAKIVDTGKSRIMRNLRLLTMAGSYGMLLSNVLVFIVLRGKLLPNGVCVQTFPWWLSILVAITDSTLCAAFLVLFVYPLYEQARVMSKSGQASADSTAKLYRVAHKNFFWGTFTIVTSFILLTIVTTVRIIVQANESKGLHLYTLYMVDWALAPLDVIANLVAAASITMAIWKRQTHVNSKKRGSKVRQIVDKLKYQNSNMTEAASTGTSASSFQENAAQVQPV